MKHQLYLLFFLNLIILLPGVAQVSTSTVKDEIYLRAEAFYNDGSYEQAADLLERLKTLKIAPDFRSIHLKIKALSHIYTKSPKYYTQLDSSLPELTELLKTTSGPSQKIQEMEDIRTSFENYKRAEKVAFDKAKEGSLAAKEEYLKAYPNMPNAEEIRNVTHNQSVEDRSSKITYLENQISIFEKKRKAKKRGSYFAATYMVVGLAVGLAGALGLSDYEEGGDGNMFKNKDTGYLLTGVGAAAFVVGLTSSIIKSSKEIKLKKKVDDLKTRLDEEKQKVVHWEPRINLYENNPSFGVRLSMKF